MTEETVRYITANSTDAGAIPTNTEIATHARASDGNTVQDVYAEQLTDGTQVTTLKVGSAALSATNPVPVMPPQSGFLPTHALIVDTTGAAMIQTGTFTGVKGLRVFGGPTDPVSDIPVYIDFAHHQVHEGETHQVTYPLTAVSQNANMDFRVVVPAGIYPHFQVEFDCLAQTTFSLYEAPTISGGNLQTARNRNRNSDIAPAVAIYYAPTVTATGAVLLDQHTVGDGSAGGRGNAVEEWLLKAGTSYLVRFTANASNNSIAVRLKWYEDLGV